MPISIPSPSGYLQHLLRVTNHNTKEAAAANPAEPGNFRPIALTFCVGKVFTSILKNRWLHYMVANQYLDTNIQWLL